MGKVEPSVAIFLEHFQKYAPDPSPTLTEITNQIAENHITDLTPMNGHFTPDTQDLLSAEAAKRWSERSRNVTSTEDLRKLWGELAREFHRQSHWNFPKVEKKVKRKKKENFAVTMIITTFTSFVVSKCLVLWFGSHQLSDPSLGNQIGLILAVLSSFVTLFYFAFRNGKRMAEEENERK